MSFLRTAIITLLLTVVSAVALQAQTATGEVNGTVTDPNGAAVPGAMVKLINQATRLETESTTNQSGYFTFVNLKPASYTLLVEVKGFKKSLTNAFDLGVSETVTHNVTLTVGEMTEVVEVSAGSELVQGSSSELGTVINERGRRSTPEWKKLHTAFDFDAGRNSGLDLSKQKHWWSRRQCRNSEFRLCRSFIPWPGESFEALFLRWHYQYQHPGADLYRDPKYRPDSGV